MLSGWLEDGGSIGSKCKAWWGMSVHPKVSCKGPVGNRKVSRKVNSKSA